MGKTAFIAAIAKESKTWLKKCVTIVRFLGTSPQSTRIKKVLASVCSQICVAYDQAFDKSKFVKMTKLTKYFVDLITYVSLKFGESRPLVILLDSIDQLSPVDGAHQCSWLPTTLPSNVHLIVSTLPDQHNCLQNIKDLFENTPKCLYELTKFPTNTAELYAKVYTSAKKVSLTESQFQCVMKKLSTNTEPLLMKLVLDEACRWYSFSDISEVRLASTTREAISCMFSKLETKYSPLFIQACLAYITLGLNGLSELELEDVLSCDDDVLQEVYKYHNPPVTGIVRIPPLMWARVRHDLREYIVERQTHNKTTVNWYHRQFIEAAMEKYASGDTFRLRHRRLVDIYLVEKTLCRTIHLPQRKLTVENADRQVTSQPNTAANIRRMTSLPYHLRHAGDEKALKEHAYCNMTFIKNYVESFSVNDLIQEMASSSDDEVEMVRNCLRYSSVQTQKNASTLATQIIGQLIDKAPDNPMVTQLCDQAQSMLRSSSKAALLPITGGIAPSTTLLKWYLNGVSDMMCQTEDGACILLKSESEKKTTSFTLLNTEALTTKPIYCKTRLVPKHCVFSKNGQKLYILCKKNFYVVCVMTGNIVASQNTDTNHKDEPNSCIAVSSNESYLALAGKDRMALLEDLMEEGAPYRARSAMNLASVVGTSNLVFASDDDHTISTHKIQEEKKVIGCIVLWDFWGKQLKTRVALPAPVEPGFLYQLSPVDGHDLVICGCENAQIVIVDVHLGKVVTDIFKELSIKAPILSAYHKHSNQLVTCIKGQQEVKVWNVDVGRVCEVATFNSRSPVTTVAMSSDSHTIITADEAGMIKLFDIPANSMKNEVKSHNGTLSKIICTDKDLVFTCATDRDREELELGGTVGSHR